MFLYKCIKQDFFLHIIIRSNAHKQHFKISAKTVICYENTSLVASIEMSRIFNSLQF